MDFLSKSSIKTKGNWIQITKPQDTQNIKKINILVIAKEEFLKTIFYITFSSNFFI